MAGIEQTLRTLRDIQGVYGSFVIAGTGALVASDLPAVFDADLFEEVGPRVTRLYETFLSGAEELDACMLRFAEHKIYLRKMTWGVIGILSTVAVNMPALRMVANLVIKKIDPEVVPSLRPTLPPAAIDLARPLVPSLTASAGPTPPPSLRLPVPPPIPRAIDPTPVSIDVSMVEPTPSAPPATRQVRMYRGRPVVDDDD
jgi:predicted regulator of Ras-like GTPase activity (Roadblock/LC7/MglB family)